MINRDQLISITLTLADWELIFGQMVFDQDESGDPVRMKPRSYAAYMLLATHALKSAKRQVLDALGGKENLP